MTSELRMVWHNRKHNEPSSILRQVCNVNWKPSHYHFVVFPLKNVPSVRAGESFCKHCIDTIDISITNSLAKFFPDSLLRVGASHDASSSAAE